MGIHLHVTFTFIDLLVFSRHSTFVMHHLLQRGWYYTIMHPPSTNCCPIPGLIRLFSWDIPTRAQGIYEDNTRGVGISQENTHIKPIIGHSINMGTHMYIFVLLYTKITPISIRIWDTVSIRAGLCAYLSYNRF